MPALRRYIDPQSGDYVVERGGPREDLTRASKVVMRLRKRRGTGIYPHIGSRLHRITRNAPGALRLAEHYAAEALEDLVRAGEIRELEIEASAPVVEGTTLLRIDVSFRDSDGDPRKVRYQRAF